jgi:predicted RNase H-like HicB family nuclease
MAGTMPHAIFVETGLDGGVAAYAAELPGCATFATSDDEAVTAIPQRVSQFTAWLREHGEAAPAFVGDNWYEVERAAAPAGGRAAFSLDELPPSQDEYAAWLRWMELAREELAEALDASGGAGAESELAAIERQDVTFVRALGGPAPTLAEDPVDRLYAARDALTDALEAAGPGSDGVRRMLRLAIANDLRAADRLRSGGAP